MQVGAALYIRRKSTQIATTAEQLVHRELHTQFVMYLHNQALSKVNLN